MKTNEYLTIEKTKIAKVKMDICMACVKINIYFEFDLSPVKQGKG